MYIFIDNSKNYDFSMIISITIFFFKLFYESKSKRVYEFDFDIFDVDNIIRDNRINSIIFESISNDDENFNDLLNIAKFKKIEKFQKQKKFNKKNSKKKNC